MPKAQGSKVEYDIFLIEEMLAYQRKLEQAIEFYVKAQQLSREHEFLMASWRLRLTGRRLRERRKNKWNAMKRQLHATRNGALLQSRLN